MAPDRAVNGNRPGRLSMLAARTSSVRLLTTTEQSISSSPAPVAVSSAWVVPSALVTVVATSNEPCPDELGETEKVAGTSGVKLSLLAES